MFRVKPSIAFVSLAMAGSLTPWLILLTLEEPPYSGLESNWVLPAWFSWSLPFFLLGLLALGALRISQTTAAYRKVLVVIGYAAITSWLVMIVLFYKAWSGNYFYINLSNIELSERLSVAAANHMLYTLFALFLGLLLIPIINSLTGDKGERLKLLRSGAMPLSRAFWSYGVKVNAILLFILLSLITLISFLGVEAAGPVVIFTYLPFIVLYLSYLSLAVLGIWNSSSSYKGPLLWAGIADFGIALLAFGIVIFLIYFSWWVFAIITGAIRFSY